MIGPGTAPQLERRGSNATAYSTFRGHRGDRPCRLDRHSSALHDDLRLAGLQAHGFNRGVVVVLRTRERVDIEQRPSCRPARATAAGGSVHSSEDRGRHATRLTAGGRHELRPVVPFAG